MSEELFSDQDAGSPEASPIVVCPFGLAEKETLSACT